MIRFRSKDSCGNDKKQASLSFAAEVSIGGASVSIGSAPASEAASEAASPASSQASLPGSTSAAQPLEHLARFKHVVSSRSGSLSLYEDGEGHLVAIDPQRFC